MCQRASGSPVPDMLSPTSGAETAISGRSSSSNHQPRAPVVHPRPAQRALITRIVSGSKVIWLPRSTRIIMVMSYSTFARQVRGSLGEVHPPAGAVRASSHKLRKRGRGTGREILDVENCSRRSFSRLQLRLVRDVEGDRDVPTSALRVPDPY